MVCFPLDDLLNREMDYYQNFKLGFGKRNLIFWYYIEQLVENVSRTQNNLLAFAKLRSFRR